MTASTQELVATDAPAPPRSPARVATGLLRTVRPHQWAKNGLVFIAPALAGTLGEGPVLLRTVGGFVAWSAVASAAYLVNDVRDARADRGHPTKCRRPIAAGQVPAPVALGAAAVAAAGGLALAAVLSVPAALVLVSYLALTFGYSMGLKRVPYLELAIVAAGFVLRTVTGSLVTGIAVPIAFTASIGSVALLAASGKRLGELADLGAGAPAHRAVLARYRPASLTAVLAASTVLAVVSYSTWAISAGAAWHGGWWGLSLLPFLATVGYFASLASGGRAADPFDLLRHDHVLQVACALWLASLLVATLGV